MKKFYFLFSFAMLSFLANAQEPFITTWEVQGTTDNDLKIWVPIVSSSDNNFTIDYGDGTILTYLQFNTPHTYSSPGTYTVTVSGNFHRLDFYSNPFSVFYNYQKIKTIEQWGENQWTSMENAFAFCSNLTINASDTPNLNQVTSMAKMFIGCTSLNQSINDWDVSNVTNIEEMFALASSFNQPLNNWNVTSVTNMSGMFYNTNSFNQPLDNWNVSNVLNMDHMFMYATSFNQPLNNWDVSSVTNMSGMFNFATLFNQPLNNWDVSSVTNMSGMFGDASAFNQPLNEWNLSSVTNMATMFSNAASFNQPIGNWDVSNVTNMSGMFGDASAFNQPLNEWNLFSVTNMAAMFSNAASFNQPINNWNVSNVTNMTYMFLYTTSFNQPLNNWDVSNVLTMDNMFFNATSFNQNLSSWEFNPNIWFNSFISYSGIDTQNYDALLFRFVQLGLENKYLESLDLQYCNSIFRDYLIYQLNWDISGDSLAEDCQGNNIVGNIIFDENNNGCDTEDPTVNNFLITASDGEYTYSTISSNEEYNLRVMEGNYTIQLLNIPDYFTASPATAALEFTGFDNEEELNFCLTANQTVADLNITLLPLNEARPGFESQYRLVVQNMGTQTIADATATFGYNEEIQEFVTASTSPASTSTNELTFSIDNLAPFETVTIDITMQTFAPPTVNGNEVINFLASVTPDSNDYTPNDNTFTYDQTVVNSFDPNDKTVLQGSEIYMEQTDEYLDYVIRFQNTGTASAMTVRIEDILHENLDWTTFTPISASHDYTVQITEGNQVEFIFNNINLPHEEADEPGSHGFVAYKIKPVEDIQIGDMITGTAGIYFDYNPPIITNSANTEVVEFLGVNDFAVKTIAVYPNPAKNIINIEPQGNVIIEGIKIYNLQGREILSLAGKQQTIDIQNLSNGVYFLNIETDKGLSRHKLIKN